MERLPFFSNTEGVNNTAVGNRSLFGNIAGINDTAVGTNALYSNSAVSGDTTEGIPSSFNTQSALMPRFLDAPGSPIPATTR